MRFTKSYVARLSNEGYVRIDHDEIEKVIAGMERGSPIIVRQGVINPSYITGIMEDRDRIREWHEECNRGSGDGDKARESGMRPLKNIFDGTTIALKMQNAQLAVGQPVHTVYMPTRDKDLLS